MSNLQTFNSLIYKKDTIDMLKLFKKALEPQSMFYFATIFSFGSYLLVHGTSGSIHQIACCHYVTSSEIRLRVYSLLIFKVFTQNIHTWNLRESIEETVDCYEDCTAVLTFTVSRE